MKNQTGKVTERMPKTSGSSLSVQKHIKKPKGRQRKHQLMVKSLQNVALLAQLPELPKRQHPHQELQAASTPSLLTVNAWKLVSGKSGTAVGTKRSFASVAQNGKHGDACIKFPIVSSREKVFAQCVADGARQYVMYLPMCFLLRAALPSRLT